jgi:hypothetical protein
VFTGSIKNWLFKRLVRRFARARGFIDPFSVLMRLRRFARPSEVPEPIELVRAGLVFHARGLVNSRAIQHNLDWIWPYWVEKQFAPLSQSFIPRAFSISHINLTHRNWTAAGLPGLSAYPLVDPRGLVTPFYDGWSLDVWLVQQGRARLLPSRFDGTRQRLLCERDRLAVLTEAEQEGFSLRWETFVEEQPDGEARLVVRYRADVPEDAELVLSVRPYNPEGISFIETLSWEAGASTWRVNGVPALTLSASPEATHTSTYTEGDVFFKLRHTEPSDDARSTVGMATGAAVFPVKAGAPLALEAAVRLSQDPDAESRRSSRPVAQAGRRSWGEALAPAAEARLPDAAWQELYEASLRTLVLLAPGEVYPGPYTYKRFWFRDAAFVIHALLCGGLGERAEALLNDYPARQSLGGFFRSQDGEWDSNGEVLWTMRRYGELTGKPPDPEWKPALVRAGHWIQRKRLADDGTPHAGLLPAGFSAEHFGPNDYYYWDDFWSIAGLRAASEMLEELGEDSRAAEFAQEANHLSEAVEASLRSVEERLGEALVPASPYRRMDAGAIGALCADYPLQLWAPGEPRLARTVRHLMEHCLVHGAFFQDMVHSGINAYLTLHIAQWLMRAGDPRFFDLAGTVARLQSPTGQWPEAIHPTTRGGCMGDGQHAWASAEWVMLIRRMFLREEPGELVLCSGLVPAWLDRGREISFGPSPTRWGRVRVRVVPRPDATEVSWEGDWRAAPERVRVRLPGHAEEPRMPAGATSIRVPREGKD